MIVIPISMGFETIISDQDFDLVNAYSWSVCQKKNTNYALTFPIIDGEQYTLGMHRLIMGDPPGMLIDHKDGNGLNNQRKNLRLCTKVQNAHNCKKHNSTSQYKGVYFAPNLNMWKVNCCRYIGIYHNEEDAALAYNRAAALTFGEFAWLNPVEDDGRELIGKHKKISSVGAGNPRTKLSDQQVKEIHRRYWTGEMYQGKLKEIIRDYPISFSAASKIVFEATWTHLNLDRGSYEN